MIFSTLIHCNLAHQLTHYERFFHYQIKINIKLIVILDEYEIPSWNENSYSRILMIDNDLMVYETDKMIKNRQEMITKMDFIDIRPVHFEVRFPTFYKLFQQITSIRYKNTTCLTSIINYLGINQYKDKRNHIFIIFTYFNDHYQMYYIKCRVKIWICKENNISPSTNYHSLRSSISANDKQTILFENDKKSKIYNDNYPWKYLHASIMILNNTNDDLIVKYSNGQLFTLCTYRKDNIIYLTITDDNQCSPDGKTISLFVINGFIDGKFIYLFCHRFIYVIKKTSKDYHFIFVKKYRYEHFPIIFNNRYSYGKFFKFIKKVKIINLFFKYLVKIIFIIIIVIILSILATLFSLILLFHFRFDYFMVIVEYLTEKTKNRIGMFAYKKTNYFEYRPN